jgi:hypothetical protein
MLTGYWVSQALAVAARLGVADLVADGPRPATDLAVATRTDAPSLRRLLRALASVGVFTENPPGAFGLTPMAALLRTGTADSMRALALMYSGEQYRAWGDLLHSVRTGTTAFEHGFGTDYFGYLARHPEADRVFNEAMIGWTAQVAGAVVEAYDFSGLQTVVDVGGGYGTLLTTVLRANPAARGVLFDRPHVAAAAGERLAAAGLEQRCTALGGDFFVEVPAGGDAYVLAQVLHDWDDERCLTILERCRRAMPAHARLLVVELVLPPGEEPSFGKWLDLHMLVMLGARERTAAEYRALLRAAGFEPLRVVPTPAGPSVMEAVPIPDA